MPDLSQYSPDKPFVPQIFSKVNLSDIFIPSPTLPEVTKPSGINVFGQGGDSFWSRIVKNGGNPFAGLGVVPAGPAAVDDYWSNRKFTSEADSYQLGSKYKDLGFMIGRDNEDLFAKHESFFGEGFNAITRLLDKVGAYTVQGYGFLGGLVGIGNKHNNYDSGSGFANWVAGAADNGLAVWGKEFADNVDNLYRPIYNEAADRDKGFWGRMVSDAEFWTGDAVDGLAFLGSAYMTSGLGKILDIGGKAVRAANSLRGLSFADEAAALSAEGVEGASIATNLSKGATITAEGAPVVPNVFSPTAGKVLKAVANEEGNFGIGRKINMGVSAFMNTAGESMMEAVTLKDEVFEKLLAEKNEDGSAKYTPEQAKNISARGAKNSFLLNLMTLMPSNLWETRIFYGKANTASARNAGSSLIRREAGLLSNAEIVKRTFGQKGLDYLKNIGTGVVAEGVWEENIQLAIERMNQTEENIDAGFFTNIGKVLNQYGEQSLAALSGSDPEASMNIGLGGFIGGGMGTVSRARDIKAIKRDVTNYNSSINAFKTFAKDLYERNDEGSIRFDKNGQPVINPTNVLSYISSLNKTLNMSELADNLKEKNMDILHSIVDNENISRLVKAYADHGMVDDLIKTLDDAKGYKTEDLMLLGLNPDKVNAATRLEEIKKKAIEYKNIYDNIEKNFFVRIRSDDKYGTKARMMKDKLYYLSTRARNLESLKTKVDSRKDAAITDISVRYNGENDSLIDRLNELHGNYTAAKKRVDYLSNGQRLIETRGLPENEFETIPVREGVNITRKKKRKAVQEQFTAVDEQDLSDAVSAMNTAEKEMKDFLIENKDAIVKNVKKNADGSFRYEVPEKNRLMYEQGVVKDQNISRDLEMARNATLNVFNRLHDIKYGERYFDQVYTKRKQDLQTEVIDNEDDQIDENLQDEPVNPVPPDAGPGVVKQPPLFRSNDDVEAANDEINKLKREKEVLEGKEDATLEDEVRIDEIDSRINELEEVLDGITEVQVDGIVGGSTNIPDDKIEEYKKVLAEIEKNKRKVIKRDGYYEIDGVKYGKVSDLIGNVVPEELRAGLQNALAAGYTVDSIVKAYFDYTLNDDFKNQIATKISEGAYNRLIKQLDVIRKKLQDDGIEIVATNVVTWDPVLKVAGEIDILAVDKKGNFKVYEIEARQARVWAQIATKTGRGPAIYDMTQKQLSAYRNLFANQYGHVPNSIAVMFPIDVKYNKEDPSGFIEKVNLKKEIRYTPTSNVQIKSKIFAPIRIGSKYDGFDMTSLFINSFIPADQEVKKERLRFLLRNEKFEKVKNGLVLTVREAEQRFQENYANQQKVIAGEVVEGYKIKKLHPDLNLYALAGNKEIEITYNGQLLGYMPAYPTLAYKGTDDKFHTLDENTDLETYKTATGNSEQTYGEFTNISKAYKNAYNLLVEKIQTNELAYTGGEFKVIKVKDYIKVEDNKYKPSQQLKFNQGTYEPVRVVGHEDLITLIELGSKLQSDDVKKRQSVNKEYLKKLEEKLGITASAAYSTAKALAKENRDQNIEKIIEIGTPNIKQVNLMNKEVQDMFDIQMSYGELDLVNVGEVRPDLQDLVINGVKVGSKSVVTVVHLDENDAVRVMMDKNTRTKTTGKKFYEIDNWANKNVETIKKALTNKVGKKVSDYVGVVETAEGKLHIISLRLKKDAKLSDTEDFIPGLGSKFSSSTTKNVFKNESVALIPKQSAASANIKLKGESIISDIYVAEDVQGLEKFGLDTSEMTNESREEKVNSFVNDLTKEEFKKLSNTFAVYELTKDELIKELIDDYNSGEWSSFDDYLEQKKCDI